MLDALCELSRVLVNLATLHGFVGTNQMCGVPTSHLVGQSAAAFD